MSQMIFHGPKKVRAIEVLLYIVLLPSWKGVYSEEYELPQPPFLEHIFLGMNLVCSTMYIVLIPYWKGSTQKSKNCPQPPFLGAYRSVNELGVQSHVYSSTSLLEEDLLKRVRTSPNRHF